MKTYIGTYTLALLLATGLTPIVIAWARKRNYVDKPDARKIHKKAIARVGGIAIFFAAMLAIVPSLILDNGVGETFRENHLQINAFLGASCLVFLLGLFDDLKNARVRTKLAVQLVATLTVISCGINIQSIHIRDLAPIQLGWLGYILTFIWIIGITNAVNLIDGLDGLAAGITAIASGFMALMAVLHGNTMLAVVMLALFGSLTGFLFFNFHPAKIFMGDCGSLFLGFTIATASVMTASKAEALVGVGLPILVLGIPIIDTLLSMLRRFICRRGIMSPDRGHFHHRLIDMGLKQHHVAIIAYLITTIISGFGLFMLLTRSAMSVALLFSCIAIILLIFRLIGSVELHRSIDGIKERHKLSHEHRKDRKKFEEAQLQLQNAKTFDQWWDCMCKAAQALEFSHMCLAIGNGESEKELHWSLPSLKPPLDAITNSSSGSTSGLDNTTGSAAANKILGQMLEIKLPLYSEKSSQNARIEIQVLRNGSLESTGRRLSLFTRLADEHGIDTICK